MQTKKLFFAAAILATVFTGCKKEEPISGDPSIELDKSSLTFEKDGDPQVVYLMSNREWTVKKDDKSSWVTVTPASGPASYDAQKITIAVDENKGEELKAVLTFTTGSATFDLTVTQNGSANKVYFNDFDKDAAVQDASKKWPYISATECWKHESGTGIANVKYITEGNQATIRNNSNSTGSGVNNVFFGSNSRFCVKNITLSEGVVNYSLSFYGIRNVYGAQAGGSIFDHSHFKLYVSDNGEKWVELQYAFEKEDPDNAWSQAKTNFTVPAGTKTLCIGIPTPGELSTYRLDDLKLAEAVDAGTAINFASGIEIAEFKEQEPVDPSKAEPKTVDEFIKLADKNTYYKLSGTISSFNPTYCSFDLTDASGKIYVYNVVDSCKTKYSTVLKDGDNVTLAGKYEYYASKSQHEVVSAVILSYKTPEHKTITTSKVSEAIAAEVGDTVILNNATVVAAAKTGYLVTDSEKTDYILVYQKTEGDDTAVSVGDVINVKSVKKEYSSMPQLAEPATTVVSSGASVTWPSPEDITASFDSFTSSNIKYVSFTGTLSISGSYYNVAVNGASENIGSLLPSAAADKWTGVPNTKFEGYYLYTSSSKYIYIILTKATASTEPYLTVSPTSISVPAAAGTATITVSSNVEWTAESDNAAFTLSAAEGSGDGTITVTCPENTTDESRTVTVTVSTATAGVSPVEVVITQSKPGGDQYAKIEKIADLAAGSYYMAAYLTKDSDKKDLSANPYHCWNGTVSGTATSNSDLNTMSYSFKDNVLTINPSPSDKEKGTAVEVSVVAVEGKANTYYVMYGGKYLASGTAATNRRMILQDAAAEWVASDYSKGGIALTGNGVTLGTASAASAFIRSYKTATQPVYGLVFFKKQ